MAIEKRRVTIVVTPEMEQLLDDAKRIFYNRNQSDMIRSLITAGLMSVREKKEDNSVVQLARKQF